jgi:N-acyl-D-aspartate/D-glutamate deacylase
MERDGKGILYLPVTNYASGNLDAVRDMIAPPNTLIGLGDGGAHVGIMCDETQQAMHSPVGPATGAWERYFPSPGR